MFIYKKGFTLAEITIVLMIIGVISAIILPIGISSMPNENVMKFKKANATLGSIVKEITSNELYYFEGDLSKKPNKTNVGANYLCTTMSDFVSAKKITCASADSGKTGYVEMGALATIKTNMDTYCSQANTAANQGFVTSDGVLWFEANPAVHFASNSLATSVDGNGFLKRYKVICIDVDGVGGEAPFGYGLRVDGKIISGTRADTWINKNIQDKS